MSTKIENLKKLNDLTNTVRAMRFRTEIATDFVEDLEVDLQHARKFLDSNKVTAATQILAGVKRRIEAKEGEILAMRIADKVRAEMSDGSGGTLNALVSPRH
jgi:translation initiation factor IF-3